MATYGSFKKLNAEAIINGTLTGSQLANLAITQAKLAANSVGSTQLANSAATSTKFASGSVGANQLANTLDFSSKTMTYRALVDGDFGSSASIDTSKFTGSVTSISSNGLATSATTDTTNASNISSGTLNWQFGGRGATNTGFSVHPSARGNSAGTIAWTTATGGHITGSSANTFQFNNNSQQVTVYQPGLYISLCEVITATSTGENDMFYHVNNAQITDFRGGDNIGNHSAVSGAIILNLAANDFVDVRVNQWHENYYSRWSFHKLGGWA
jgi:hypothetical protein